MLTAQLRSSNLASASYDPDIETLTVEFNSGAIYSYSGVPQAVYEGLVSAPSPGRYFAAAIKDAYSFTREG